MAIGVFQSEAEYYNDSETYTGDPGSETNKYVVKDVYDFLKIDAPTTIYTHFTLVNDINFSDHETYRYGISTSRLINNTYITVHANGHKIRNLIVKNMKDGNPVFVFYRLYDAVFENFIFIGTVSRTAFGCKCIRCKFGVYLFNGPATGVYPYNCEDCSFNVCGVCTGTPFAPYNSGTYTRCHINFDLVTINGNVLTEFSSISVKDTYFTGKCEFKSNMTDILGAGSWYTSYVSVEVTIPNTTDEIGFRGSMFGGTSFINIGLLPKNAADAVINDGEFYALTDDQCKDATYLVSIGFPVLPI